jgi:hypothetical protein
MRCKPATYMQIFLQLFNCCQTKTMNWADLLSCSDQMLNKTDRQNIACIFERSSIYTLKSVLSTRFNWNIKKDIFFTKDKKDIEGSYHSIRDVSCLITSSYSYEVVTGLRSYYVFNSNSKLISLCIFTARCTEDSYRFLRYRLRVYMTCKNVQFNALFS